MARPKNDGVGKISFKKRADYYEAGVWVQTPGGKKFYKIGRKGDPDLQRKYVEFCNRYYTAPAVRKGEAVMMATLFREYLEKRLPRLHQVDRFHVKKILGLVAERYGLTRVEDFDSVAFREVQAMVAEEGERQQKPWSFSYCNKLIKYLRAILKWGVGRKLFTAANLLEIQAVEAIGQGDEVYDLSETVQRADVPDWVVRKSMPYLPPTLQDMVRLIRGACLRPSELARMRVQDIMESRDNIVEIGHHKTQRHHIRRFAAFTPAEMRILRKYTIGKGADEHLFSPRDTMREKNFRGASLLRFSEEYTTHTLGCWLRRCLDRARADGVKIPYWTLYQLRHASVTENSRLFGVETAAYIAGHKDMKTTAIYDHKAVECARAAAKKRAERDDDF